MKLGELCEVMNMDMNVQYRDEDNNTVGFFVNGDSFQQMIHRCGEHAFWDVVEITQEVTGHDYLDVEIVKPEEEE